MATRGLLGSALLLAVVAIAWAQDPADKPDGDASRAGRATPARRAVPGLPTFTPQREAAAISFVEQHHPALAELLTHLKRDNAKQYERAVRELFRTSERLAQQKERDAERYAIDLETWKLDSRIQLLAVRLRLVADDAGLQKELRGAIERKADLRLKRLELERARLQARVDKLNETIEKLEADRDGSIERSVNQVLNTIKPRVRPRKRETDDLTSVGDATIPTTGSSSQDAR